jgi:hypothetical protein
VGKRCLRSHEGQLGHRRHYYRQCIRLALVATASDKNDTHLCLSNGNQPAAATAASIAEQNAVDPGSL